MEALIVLWIACAIIGAVIDGFRGAVLGGLLGIIGILVAAILSGQDKKHKEVLAALTK